MSTVNSSPARVVNCRSAQRSRFASIPREQPRRAKSSTSGSAQQPPAEPAVAPPRSRVRSPLWFLAGRAGRRRDHVRRTQDAVHDARRARTSTAMASTTRSITTAANVLEQRRIRSQRRRQDRRALDQRHSAASCARYEGDDDFDGRFEWTVRSRGGAASSPRRSMRTAMAGPTTWSHLQERRAAQRSKSTTRRAGESSPGRPIEWRVQRAPPNSTMTVTATFERRVEYDRYGEPKAR